MTARVLLVGLGQIGMGYDLRLDPSCHVFSHARAFSQHPAFDLVAAVDPDADRRQEFEESYRRPTYQDVASALGRHQVDVVTLAAPTRFHGETLHQVLAAAEPRAILCEKPLSYGIAEARAIVQACEARGVALYVNYMRRSDPGVIDVRRRLASGDIQTPGKGVVWYSKGLLHNGSHFFNLMELWLGPMEAFDVLEAGRLWNDEDPEPDVRVQFRDGAVVFLAAREEAFSHYTVELVTPNGRLRYEQLGAMITWQPVQSDPHLSGYTVLSPVPQPIESGRDRYQWHVADQLAAALDGRTFHLCSGSEALTTLESLHGITEDR